MPQLKKFVKALRSNFLSRTPTLNSSDRFNAVLAVNSSSSIGPCSSDEEGAKPISMRSWKRPNVSVSGLLSSPSKSLSKTFSKRRRPALLGSIVGGCDDASSNTASVPATPRTPTITDTELEPKTEPVQTELEERCLSDVEPEPEAEEATALPKPQLHKPEEVLPKSPLPPQKPVAEQIVANVAVNRAPRRQANLGWGSDFGEFLDFQSAVVGREEVTKLRNQLPNVLAAVEPAQRSVIENVLKQLEDALLIGAWSTARAQLADRERQAETEKQRATKSHSEARRMQVGYLREITSLRDRLRRAPRAGELSAPDGADIELWEPMRDLDQGTRELVTCCVHEKLKGIFAGSRAEKELREAFDADSAVMRDKVQRLENEACRLKQERQNALLETADVRRTWQRTEFALTSTREELHKANVDLTHARQQLRAAATAAKAAAAMAEVTGDGEAIAAIGISSSTGRATRTIASVADQEKMEAEELLLGSSDSFEHRDAEPSSWEAPSNTAGAEMAIDLMVAVDDKLIESSTPAISKERVQQQKPASSTSTGCTSAPTVLWQPDKTRAPSRTRASKKTLKHKSR
eukprot:gnl/TRDRNA2_/TRDRNA2_37409_c0_seq1.p1 gnl/TRDRNA2_/TRDRNA2_37409_c0~~gnl/TRDRNA2_/TRDRNA2_37409_c0_seq1.p1  ORF type:complete len:578 (+),score=126.97 gnl/TRDRNA2_/TRDRNA2_37409_c0_seq1:53-1786(+)